MDDDMQFLVYIGDHKKDTLLVQAGWWLTRRMQSGEYKQVTHMECVLSGENYKNCEIASSSARDGGVRIKPGVALNKNNWRVLDVSKFDAEKSRPWFEVHRGEPYSWVGAAATKLTAFQFLALALRGFFCNWSCLASCGLYGAHKETPSQSVERLVRDHAAVDVTAKFFED
jgi:hypothetical protein